MACLTLRVRGFELTGTGSRVSALESVVKVRWRNDRYLNRCIEFFIVAVLGFQFPKVFSYFFNHFSKLCSCFVDEIFSNL